MFEEAPPPAAWGRYAREYLLAAASLTWGGVATAIGLAWVASLLMPSLANLIPLSPPLTAAIVFAALFLAPYFTYAKMRAREEALEKKIGRFEAVIFGGEPIVAPARMRLDHRLPALAARPIGDQKYLGEFRLFDIPPTALEVQFEFTWPPSGIEASIVSAKNPDSVQARDEARGLRVKPNGLFGCIVELPSPLPADALLCLWARSSEPLALRSARARF